MSQQGLRQQAFRDIGGSASNYNEDLMTAIDSFIPSTENHINGKMIAWLQQALSSSKTDLPGLQAEAAAAVGANNWASIGAEISELLYPPADVSSLAAWYKYNTGITVTGAGVSQWDDQSGNSRHLLQGVDAQRPSKEGDGSILFDGANDGLKTSSFTLNQPETVYILCKQASWANQDRIFDGDALNTLALIQNTPTPDISIYAGSFTANNSDFTINTYAAIAAVFNGASSLTQVDGNTPATGDAGAGNAGGFTLGARGDVAASNSNIQVKEVAIYSAAHDAATRAKVIAYLNAL